MLADLVFSVTWGVNSGAKPADSHARPLMSLHAGRNPTDRRAGANADALACLVWGYTFVTCN